MKKLVLTLLLLASSLFAVTTSQIMNADPAYQRAYITQIDIRDSNEVATKLNLVDYPYMGAGYPYTNVEYNGRISTWYYTFDYSNFYYYSSGWDQYLDPNDLSVTYVYFNTNSFSINGLDFYYYAGGQKIAFSPSLVQVGTNVWRFKHTNSTNVTSYVISTNITASDGTVILENRVSVNRNEQ